MIAMLIFGVFVAFVLAYPNAEDKARNEYAAKPVFGR